MPVNGCQFLADNFYSVISLYVSYSHWTCLISSTASICFMCLTEYLSVSGSAFQLFQYFLDFFSTYIES
jgi:hypothetical protein